MNKTILLILFLLPMLCFGATFTVTSNASLGAGTLRQAVLAAAANGDAQKDTIQFNLPPGQTTIIISSSLVLPGNLIIDGTTQPGSFFGLTNAKVRLQSAGCLQGFIVHDKVDVQLFGLWMSDFVSAGNNCHGAAISLKNTDHFVLGMPGKGNLFSNNTYTVLNPWQEGDNSENTNIKIQGNRIAMDTLTAPDYAASMVQFGATRNLIFGGYTVAQGNRIGNALVTAGNESVPLSAVGDSIVIANNVMGFDAFNGPLLSKIGFKIIGYKSSKSDVNIYVVNNKIGKDDVVDKIFISNIKGNISIAGNYIGSLNSVVVPGENVAGLHFNNCERKDSLLVYNNTINGYVNAVKLVLTQQVTISNNQIYCNAKGINYAEKSNIPLIFLKELSGSVIKGITTPQSKVEIFWNNTCTNYCENGRQLLATVFAGNDGTFEYSGTIVGQVALTATAPSGTTSEFYAAKINTTGIVIKNATCGQPNGSVSGLQLLVGTSFYWEDINGVKVGSDTILKNQDAGDYRFAVKDSLSACMVYSPYYTIKAIPKPSVDTNDFSVNNTACNKNMGKVRFAGAKPSGSITIWQDSLFNIIKMDGDSLTQLAPGKYYFKIALQEDSACSTAYGPFIVAETKAAAINDVQTAITAADCNSSNGSIKGILINNNPVKPVFIWEDSLGKIVGNNLDLINQPAGRYRLKFKDDTPCDTLFSAFYTIGSRGGINMDSSKMKINAASCVADNGSVSGIIITGATYYRWVNVATNQQVGDKVNLQNIASGNYKLYAGNNIGCNDSSVIINVPQSAFKPITITTIEVQQPNCNLVNGYVRPTFSADTLNYRFTWTDSINNKLLNNITQLNVADAGNYFLSATDTNGCSGKILSIQLTQTGKPQLDFSNLKLVNDTCDLSIGSISNLQVTGGKPPYTWQWLKNNSSLPITTSFANNLSKGNYQVNVKDSYNCAITGSIVNISSINKIQAPPIIDNQYILRNTVANLEIKNYNTGVYLLYDSIGFSPIRTSGGPRLLTPIVSEDKLFRVKYGSGTCYSDFAPIQVRVFNKSQFSLPNAFSPNGDGINDMWAMQVQGIVKIKEWLVFNRFGQLVFSSSDASKGWNGTLKNTPVPVGTYYWVVTAYDQNGKLLKSSGSVLVLK